MPSSNPLITVPTISPRRSGSASAEAHGTTHLRCRRGDAGGEYGRQQHGEVRRRRGNRKGRNRSRQQNGNHPAAIQEVAQRHQQREPAQVADLRGTHQQGRGRRRDGQLARDLMQQRLQVVETTGGRPRGHGEDEHDKRARRDIVDAIDLARGQVRGEVVIGNLMNIHTLDLAAVIADMHQRCPSADPSVLYPRFAPSA
jgi:hypothetical protein